MASAVSSDHRQSEGEQHLLILCHLPWETSKAALICSTDWISASGNDWLEEGSKGEKLICSEGNKKAQEDAMTVLDGTWLSLNGGSSSYHVFDPCGGSCSAAWLMSPEWLSLLCFTAVASLRYPNPSCCICPHPCFWHAVITCISAHWEGKGRQRQQNAEVFFSVEEGRVLTEFTTLFQFHFLTV